MRFAHGRQRSAGQPWLAVALVMLLAGIMAMAPPTVAQEVPELKINSARYIVIDAETGEIFAQRNAHEQAAMASLTKVFTLVEALESGPLSTRITTTDDDMVSDQASVMGFGPGESFTLEDLLYGLMLPSGNDAAHAIARTFGSEQGDDAEAAVDRFVARINERVRNMGLTETNIITPDGWGVPGHYSSAHDLAVFTMYALRYPTFVDTISTKTYETSNGGYQLRNNNRLLGTYSNLLGGKTGYDNDSGYCLIEVAERDGMRMISVTLDGVPPEDWYDDNRVLLEYAFDQKAARQETGVGIVGQRVGYLDPDAAVIMNVADPGGSLGQPVDDVDITGEVGATTAPARGGTGEPPSTTPALIVAGRPAPGPGTTAVLVAVALILLRTLSTLPLLGAASAARTMGDKGVSRQSGHRADSNQPPPG